MVPSLTGAATWALSQMPFIGAGFCLNVLRPKPNTLKMDTIVSAIALKCIVAAGATWGRTVLICGYLGHIAATAVCTYEDRAKIRNNEKFDEAAIRAGVMSGYTVAFTVAFLGAAFIWNKVFPA